MKKVLATGTVVVLLAACSSAQKNEKPSKEPKIPAIVQDAFKQRYPNISDADWEKEGKNYEASFENNETETSVVIDASGKILETETEMETSALPKAVLDYIAANYKGQKIKEATKIVLGDGTINYEAEINEKDLIFESNGSFINVIGK